MDKGSVDSTLGLDGEKIMQCVFIDITSQKEKEKVAIEHSQIIEEIYNNIPCAIIHLSVKKPIKILDFNQATYKIYGYESREEFSIEIEKKVLGHVYNDDLNNVIELIKESIEKPDSRTFQYRLVRKNGEMIWAQGTIRVTKKINGEEVLELVFLDVTDTIQKNQQKTKNNELYKLLMEDSKMIIFDYDPVEDKMNYSFFLIDGNRDDTEVKNYLKNISQSSVIHPDHKNCFIKTIKEACNKPRIGRLECVADFSDVGYRWYRVEYKSIEDETNNVFRLIGRVYDIQEEVESSKALKKRAETDDLSGLLNRVTAKEIMDSRIRSANDDEKYAFLLIDIDKFKSINDVYGHPKGDDVIKEIANEIKAQFREEDVVARIGGDEFAVLFSTRKNDLFATKKAGALIKKVEFIPKIKQFDFPISISVGIAIAPENGDSFDKLFEKADIAMYMAKDKGGGCYQVI